MPQGIRKKRITHALLCPVKDRNEPFAAEETTEETLRVRHPAVSGTGTAGRLSPCLPPLPAVPRAICFT